MDRITFSTKRLYYYNSNLITADDEIYHDIFISTKINKNKNLIYKDKLLIKDPSKDQISVAKFIMEKINNCKLNIRVYKKYKTSDININVITSESITGIKIKFTSIDDLLPITDYSKLLLCYLNDLLIKLKLNMEITPINEIYTNCGYLDYEKDYSNNCCNKKNNNRIYN